MEYNVYIKGVHSIKSLYEKVERTSMECDRMQLLHNIEDVDKYMNDTDNIDAYRELLAENFHITLMKMLTTFIDRDDLTLLSAVCKFVSALTEYSEEFSESLVREDIPDLLISATIKYGDDNFIVQFTSSPLFDDVIYYVLHITYHIIRHVRFQQCFLLHKDITIFKQAIIPWMSSKIVNTRILATFVLTWLTKEDQEDKYIIEKNIDIVQNVCEYIKEGLRTQEKYYRGYSLWELLLGLKALAVIDSLKVEMVNIDGFVDSLVEIVNSKNSEPKEIEISLAILWSLAFIKQNREILKNRYHLQEIVQSLSRHKDGQIRKNVKGLLWEMDRKRTTNDDKEGFEYDVFISYCHTQKDTIHKLADVLKQQFKVWIDTDNMKGSGLSDMANGIEQSKIFIMAVSSSYKESQCCRSEANWAFKLNKPIIPLMMVHKYCPDGWLGMMISSETYIDLSENTDFKEASTKIIKHVTHKCNHAGPGPGTATGVEENKNQVKRDSIDSIAGSTNLPRNVRNWNSQNVSHWLCLNKLSQLKSKFADFDGGMLLALKNMMEKTYEKYTDHLEDNFTMTLTEILKLDSALSSLSFDWVS